MADNPDQVTQLFENLKESLETKQGEKRNKIEADRKNNWEKIEREILDAQHERNRNVIIEIMD